MIRIINRPSEAPGQPSSCAAVVTAGSGLLRWGYGRYWRVFDYLVRLRLGAVHRPDASGLTNEEYFWEPAEGCWNLRLGDDGGWHLDGDGGGGPAPEPVPITTIAWRIGHLAGMAVGGFADRLFGEGTMTPSNLDYPPSSNDVPRFLAQHYQTWRAGLAGIDQHAYLRPVGPAWGPYAESSTLDVTLHVFDEVVHHAAEVALLRDLYPHRDQLRR